MWTDLYIGRPSSRAVMFYRYLSKLPRSFVFDSSVSKANILNIWIIIMTIRYFIVAIRDASIYDHESPNIKFPFRSYPVLYRNMERPVNLDSFFTKFVGFSP